MNTYELPAINQKSFYGKAKVHEHDGVIMLQSYDTNMMQIKDSQVTSFNMNEFNYSRTTMKHVNAFLDRMGLPQTNIAKVRLSIENGEWYDE